MVGDHKGALNDLEQILPIALAASKQNTFRVPHLLNAYAIELAEVGRLEEAKNISRRALASPYARVYPEWHETARDIAERTYKSRLITPGFAETLTNSKNILQMPLRCRENQQPAATEIATGRRHAVVSLAAWKKKKRLQAAEDEPPRVDPSEMSEREMIHRIVLLFTDPKTTDQKRAAMTRAIEEVAARPDSDFATV
jgi:hypothetical protein